MTDKNEENVFISNYEKWSDIPKKEAKESKEFFRNFLKRVDNGEFNKPNSTFINTMKERFFLAYQALLGKVQLIDTNDKEFRCGRLVFSKKALTKESTK